VLRKDLDRGGLQIGGLAGGETGEKGGLGGLKRRDLEQRERGEAFGESSLGVSGGCSGAGENSG
jgi:hypothetical protein